MRWHWTHLITLGYIFYLKTRDLFLLHITFFHVWWDIHRFRELGPGYLWDHCSVFHSTYFCFSESTKVSGSSEGPGGRLLIWDPMGFIWLGKNAKVTLLSAPSFTVMAGDLLMHQSKQAQVAHLKIQCPILTYPISHSVAFGSKNITSNKLLFFVVYKHLPVCLSSGIWYWKYFSARDIWRPKSMQNFLPPFSWFKRNIWIKIISQKRIPEGMQLISAIQKENGRRFTDYLVDSSQDGILSSLGQGSELTPSRSNELKIPYFSFQIFACCSFVYK